MSLSGKQWILTNHNNDQDIISVLAGDLGLAPAVARLLVNRGITNPGQARDFLCPSKEQFHSPWKMLGMKEAVKRLLTALEKGEKIVIHGDYDADGITASAILVEALHYLDADVDYYLPDRFGEGYGLHTDPLKQFKENGASLVVTVDCGINAAEEIKFAVQNGLDMIITDHHQPLESIEGAVAVINPRQEKCDYPFRELSGAGIAFKLASALMEKAGGSFPDHLLDLAALGTTADVVPLFDENRNIVYSGLNILRSMKRVGFNALIEAVSLDVERITSTALSFILAPAINAAGRMGEALPAAQLLLETDPAQAKILAEKLHQANQTRRSTEKKILIEAEEATKKMLAEDDHRIITLAGENWHHGVIGIVASRLVEKFNRPACLIALEGEQGRGSARSIAGFDITAALANCSAFLERFGGHDQAAGFSVQSGQVDALREGLNIYARQNLGARELKPRLYIESELDPSEIKIDLTTQIEQLQPFGTGNPVPLFASRDWDLKSWRLVGSDQKHLKLKVQKNGLLLDPIIFSGAFLEPRLEKGRRVDLAFRLKDSFYRGKKTLEAEVKDLSYSDTATSGYLEIIDRRQCKDRLACVTDILNRNGKEAVVFAATISRSKVIEKNCSLKEPPVLITSGSMNEYGEVPTNSGPVVLYDLPLHGGLLKKMLIQRAGWETLPVYLLYNTDDLQQNLFLMDISLPSEELLGKILDVIIKNPKGFTDEVFPGIAQQKVDFKPAPSFWKRAESIFSEIGLLENGYLTRQSGQINHNWPECLVSSATYQATKELRENCEQFQKLLLEAPPEEIASCFQSLGSD